MTKTTGCVYRCLDRDCNLPTFEASAKCCAHCGSTNLRAEHLGGIFSVDRQAFICSTCGEEYAHDSTCMLRKKAKDGVLDSLAPGASALFDLTEH